MTEPTTPQPRSSQAPLPVATPAVFSGMQDVIAIERPGAGQVKVVDILGAKHIHFGFNLADCVVSVLDVDAVLLFPDGGKIIMPTLMLQIVSAEPPIMQFHGETIDSQSILQNAGDIRLIDQLPQLAASDSVKSNKTGDEASPQGPQAVQMPAAQHFANTPVPTGRSQSTVGLGEGDALSESNGRYARRVNLDEQQSSSLKGEGALTEGTAKGGNGAAETANHTPEIVSGGGQTNATAIVLENSQLVTRVAATDADAVDVITYSITGGADSDLFAINGQTGQLYFIERPDFEALGSSAHSNTYDVIVQASDGHSADVQHLSVTVLDRNEAPTSLTMTNTIVSEAAVAGTVVGRAVGADSDAGAVLTYSFAPNGDANGRFAIDAATGQITVHGASPLNFESSPTETIIIRTTDEHGLFVDSTVVIRVTDANDAPMILSNGAGDSAILSLVENSTHVTTVSAVDPDVGATLTYTIAGGADAALFTIDATTGELRFISAPDFEMPGSAAGTNVYDVQVQVSDGLGGVDTQTLAVSVTNINEAPTDIVMWTTGGVREDEVAGGFVASVSGIDPDAGDSVTYSFAPGGNAGGIFDIDAVDGTITLHASNSLNFATDPAYTIIVRATDSGGLHFDQVFTINVIDVNQAPVITSDGGGDTANIFIGEGSAVATTVVATDADVVDTLTYSIIGGADATAFTIDAATGVLSFVTAPNFENPLDANHDNVFEVIVQVTDGNFISVLNPFTGLFDSVPVTDTQTLTITVQDVNEAPVIQSNGGGTSASLSIAENTTALTTVSATDPDAGATLTYTIAGGADAARFTINAATGVLTFVTAPNFEAPTDADGNNIYQVVVAANDGLGGVDTQTLSITVTNTNEAPIISSNGGGATAAITLSEGVATATTVMAVDPDAGATVTYSIVGGADAANFTINATTGALIFNSTPDFEMPTDVGGNHVYDVIVQASDGTLIDTQTLAITIVNVNEAPVISSNGGGATATLSISENTTAVTTVTAFDFDSAPLTYSIAGGVDAARFSINALTGVLTFVSAPNFEGPVDSGGNNVYDVIVQVSDGSMIDTQAIAVTVTNVNEAPVITSNGGGASASISVMEGTTAVTTMTATDPDASSFTIYSIIGGADAARFTINGLTGALTFIGAPDFETPTDTDGNNIYDVIVQAEDFLGGLDTQTLAVTVTNVNEAPTIVSNGGISTVSLTMAENGTAVTTVAAVDPDASAIITYSIVGGADAARFAINASTGVLTFVSAPNFEAPLDVGANNLYDVVVQASDGLGGVDTQTIAVTITNANEAPVITSNGGGATASISAAENGTAVTTVTAVDPDAGATLNYTIVGGADAGRFTINASTGVLTFVAAPNFEAPVDVGGNNVYDVQVQVSDGLGGTTTQTIAVTVTNDNEAPVITSNGGGATAALTVNENIAAVTTVTASDVDAATTLTYSIIGGVDAARFAINATTGVLTFVSAPNFESPSDVGAGNVYDVQVQVSDGLGGVATQTIAVTVANVNETPVITSNGGGTTASVSAAENGTAVTTVTATDPDAGATLTYTIVGGVDAARFTINASTGVLTFIAAPNFETPSDVGANNVYDVQVQVSDGLGGTTTQTIAVTVTNDNEAPTITSNGGGATASLSINENTTAITTVTSTDPDAGATKTYSIAGGADAAFFAINASTGVLTITSRNFESKLDAGANNVYDVIVQVSDGLGGTAQQAIAVTILNVNEAPSISSTAAYSVAENSTAVGTVTATDPDAGAVKIYSISGGADAAAFTINSSTGVLSFITAPNFEVPTDVGANNIYNVTVQVSDGLGLTGTKALTITVTNVNETPVITSNGGGASASVTMAENGAAITTVVGADVDAGTTFTYSISGGADAALFSINASTGALTFVSAPNFEAPTDVGANNVYDVIVRVSDGALTATQAIAVTVTNVNDAPVITSNSGGATAAFSVVENQPMTTTVTATDQDAGATLTYSIIGGADAALFTINASSGQLTFISNPNFESPTDVGANNVYDVTVQVSDGTLTDTQAIAITVTDLNEAPVITSNGAGSTASVSISENGTAVTTVTATDIDAGATQTYSIIGGADAALFTINAATGALSFISAPDFETPGDVGGNNVYDVTVQVSDGTLTDAQAIAVTVTNANEAPVITSDGAGSTASVSISENGTAVATVTVTDIDAGATQTYSIIGGADAALFTINAATGVLTFISAPNFEAPGDVGGNNVYDVTVQVSDGTLTDTQAIAITVTNVNEAPVITSNGAGSTASVSISENTTSVTTVTVTDVDAGATQTYSIIGGADAALFTINASTGVLTFISAPNFETPGDVGGNNVYDVTVQVSDGTLTDTQAIAVTVTNVNEAPVITSDGAGSTASVSISENSTAVTTATATDVDAGALHTYSIIGGADAALFTINAATGILTFLSAPDYESPTDAGGNNVYDVQVQVSDGTLTDTQDLAITVTDVAPTINGDNTANALVGTAENDTINGLDGNDLLNGGDGNDTINGGNGLDTLNGGNGDDVLNGGAGFDNLYGGAGADVLDGGSNIDYADYSGETADLTINLSTGTGSGGEAAGDTYISIEGVVGSSGNDTIIGTTNYEEFIGGDGNDTFITNGSGDIVLGDAGNDTMIVDASSLVLDHPILDGGSGSDTLSLTGTGTITAADLTACLSTVETIDFTSAGVVANLADFHGSDAASILGVTGSATPLTLDLDGNDTFTVAAGEFYTAASILPGVVNYTFFTDVSLTTEVARVSIT
ncbi:MAG: hypothetical protein CFE31_10930 [Rhizobiales bacterium PAR1]|nr:MAG: hypothetical protein CFE31_10930 [Rhizobiales bacterium PAR1]